MPQPLGTVAEFAGVGIVAAGCCAYAGIAAIVMAIADET
ncbi:hypothetical protein APY03_3233 [Variovorax sp. WDL1]|nr:hypothetical protein APY03_3233 [Variovorax sp. WDL1]